MSEFQEAPDVFQPSLGLGTGRGLALARLAYLALLCLATLLPFGLDADLSTVSQRLERAFDPRFTPRDAVDAARNLTLFAGWGALWALSSASRNGLLLTAGATATGALVSSGIEALQLFSAQRTASVLDLVANVAGALAGAFIIVVLTRVAGRARGRRLFVGLPGFLFAGAYLGAVFLEAVFPTLRRFIVPGAYGGPLTRFAAALRHLELSSILAIPFFDIALFAPAGALCVLALLESGHDPRRAASLTARVGFLVVALAEIAHGALGLAIGLGAILAHSVGIAGGAAAVALWRPRLPRDQHATAWAAGFLAAYAAVLLLWAWRPFVPELNPPAIAAQLSLRRLVPLRAQAQQVDLFSVADIAEPLLLFFPLGCLLAVWPLRWTGLLRHFLPALYLAGIAELGQIFLSGRFFDVTDILTASAGSVAGWLLLRRAGYAPQGELATLVWRQADSRENQNSGWG